MVLILCLRGRRTVFTQHWYLYFWSLWRGTEYWLAFCPAGCNRALLTVRRSWSADLRVISSRLSWSISPQKYKTDLFFFLFFSNTITFLQSDVKNAALPLHHIRRSNKDPASKLHWKQHNSFKRVDVFGSKLRKPLDLWKADHNLVCSWRQSTEPFVLSEQPRGRQCWCGHFSVVTRQRVQRVIHSAERAIGCNLPSHQDV